MFSFPISVTFDLTFLKYQMDNMAGVPSMLITVANDKELTVNVPGMSKTETENGPCLSIQMPGLRMPKGESQAVACRELVVDNNLLIYLKTSITKQLYLAGIKLPPNLDLNGKVNVLISKGVFNITLPVLKNTDSYIMPDFVDTMVKLPRPTPYCGTINEYACHLLQLILVLEAISDLGKELCEVIAHPGVKSKSFTMYKKDTGESIYMKGNLPGVENIVVTGEGLCVSLNMPGFEIQDVDLGFEYDTLIIEGKREDEHYIAGVRVPEGFRTEHCMIKREMQDGVYKATLPHVEDGEKKTKRRVFSLYR
ncbi:putative Heat shock protein HSP14.7/HSP23.5/HSP23.6 [Helianthus annuus]|nr:putative Heat shock protein HSP14.7/HSP23.5/HSP23.6 [Helianthus annuus]